VLPCEYICVFFVAQNISLLPAPLSNFPITHDQTRYSFITFQVSAVFMTHCDPVGGCQHFGKTQCLHQRFVEAVFLTETSVLTYQTEGLIIQKPQCETLVIASQLTTALNTTFDFTRHFQSACSSTINQISSHSSLPVSSQQHLKLDYISFVTSSQLTAALNTRFYLIRHFQSAYSSTKH
jgi:hypothetical protein